MDYMEFKDRILEELQDFYEDNAELESVRIQKNNGFSYDGIKVMRNDKNHNVVPIIRLDELYEEYVREDMDMKDCVKSVLSRLEYSVMEEGLERFTEKLGDWNLIKNKVYPILLSTEDNRELLEELASTPMLDLSVVYIIRFKTKDGSIGSMKISKKMLENFGLSTGQLHEHAMKNLEKDGYEFRDMDALIMKMMVSEEYEELTMGKREDKKMHILTNACKTYGAAGILDKKLLKKFAGEKDYFILPSSIHETIFVPVNDNCSKEEFDNMVAEVNKMCVSVEERLGNHSYYYDAKAREIRMCA